MLDEDRDAAVVIRITTASGFDSDRNIQNRKFYVLFRTSAGSQQSKVKTGGDHLKWDDYFYYNMKDLQTDDLLLTLIMDDDEVGSCKLTYKRIKKQFGTERQSTKLLLELNGRSSGYLHAQIQRMRGQQIVGGIQPPMVTLKPGVSLDSSYQQPVSRGIQKIRTSKLNFFSFCDANDLGREFMPPKFNSKSLQTFLMTQSLAKIAKDNKKKQKQNKNNDINGNKISNNFGDNNVRNDSYNSANNDNYNAANNNSHNTNGLNQEL